MVVNLDVPLNKLDSNDFKNFVEKDTREKKSTPGGWSPGILSIIIFTKSSRMFKLINKNSDLQVL